MSAIIEANKGVAQSKYGICHFGHYAERYVVDMKFQLTLLFIITMSLLILGCNEQESTISLPNSIVEKHIQAYSEQDAEETRKYWGNYSNWNEYHDAFDEIHRYFAIEIRNVETMLTSQSGSTCKINVGYAVEATSNGATIETMIFEVVELVQVDNHWLIDNIVDLVSENENLKVLIELMEVENDRIASRDYEAPLVYLKERHEKEIQDLLTQINDCNESGEAELIK